MIEEKYNIKTMHLMLNKTYPHDIIIISDNKNERNDEIIREAIQEIENTYFSFDTNLAKELPISEAPRHILRIDDNQCTVFLNDRVNNSVNVDMLVQLVTKYSEENIAPNRIPYERSFTISNMSIDYIKDRLIDNMFDVICTIETLALNHIKRQISNSLTSINISLSDDFEKIKERNQFLIGIRDELKSFESNTERMVFK